MQTLIVPCAGRSSRFPKMKPKWLLTHPDGTLMIEKALARLNLNSFDRIIFTIVREHDEKFDASLILRQIFPDSDRYEICILDSFTKSASETVYLTLEEKKVVGGIVIKDSDNGLAVRLPDFPKNYIVGYDLIKHPHVSNITGKSFLVVNDQGIVSDIIEKRIVSNIICLGVYAFEDADMFRDGYSALVKNEIEGEMFVSHVISYLLSKGNFVFEHVEAIGFDDWGTLDEWKNVQKQYRTYFVDVDGVLLKNSGKYGRVNWGNNVTVIEKNMRAICKIQNEGGQIVITTSRPESLRSDLERILNEHGVRPHAIVMGLNHAARVLINDFAPTNPFPSSQAISIPRDSDVSDYLMN